MLKIDRIREIERKPVARFFVLLILVIVTFLLIFLLWFKPQPVTHKVAATPVASGCTGVQVGWKCYENATYHFAIAYPGDYSVDETYAQLAIEEAGGNRQAFDVAFTKSGADAQSTLLAPIEIRVSDQTLDQVIAGRKKLIANNNANVAIQSTMLSDEPLVINGNTAERIDEKDIDKTPTPNGQPVEYTTYIYIAAANRIYMLQTTSQKKDSFDDDAAQVMYQSFTVAAK